MLGDHLAWLEPGEAFAVARQNCKAISGMAKTLQFQMARAVARGRSPQAAALIADIAGARLRVVADVDSALET